VTGESLARRYRPERFTDLAGQPAAAFVLYRMLHEETPDGWKPRKVPKVPQALIMTGTRGSGKTSSARILGAALNCEAESSRPCTECQACRDIRAGTSLAVVEIDAASNGTVDQVHRLQELVSYDVLSPYRVVILDEAHGLSPAGTEALLKLLEEPPPRTVFALLTTERGKIKKTIFSRCTAGMLTFRRITPADITARLQHIAAIEDITVEPALLAAIADRADGSLRDAVGLLEQMAAAGVTQLTTFEAMHGLSDFAPWLVAHMIQGNYAWLFGKVEEIVSATGDYRMITDQLVACLPDVLVLKHGGQVTSLGTALEHRQRIARHPQATDKRLARFMAVLWDLRTKTRAEDPRSSLDLALTMGLQVLSEPDTPASNGTNGHKGHAPEMRVVTVDDLREAAAQ